MRKLRPDELMIRLHRLEIALRELIDEAENCLGVDEGQDRFQPDYEYAPLLRKACDKAKAALKGLPIDKDKDE